MSSLLCWIFSNFWHFSTLFWLFLTCKYSKQKLLNYKNFTIPFLCNSQSIETRPETFETETRKDTEIRPRDSITDDFIYAVLFYNNHTWYPTTIRWKTRTNFALIELKFELNWYLKPLLLVNSMCFVCTFVSFLSLCHEIKSGAISWIIISLIPA